jgi:hypothetical protein
MDANTKNRFSSSFDEYVCEGDTITAEIDGFTVIARIERDEDSHIDDDCHDTDQDVTGCDDEQQAKLLSARKAWQNDEWFYCGIVLSVSRRGVMLDEHASSLWSIEANYPESNNGYLTEVANELIEEAIESGRKAIDKITEDYTRTEVV